MTAEVGSRDRMGKGTGRWSLRRVCFSGHSDHANKDRNKQPGARQCSKGLAGTNSVSPHRSPWREVLQLVSFYSRGN